MDPSEEYQGSVSCPRILSPTAWRNQGSSHDLPVGGWPALPPEPQLNNLPFFLYINCGESRPNKRRLYQHWNKTKHSFMELLVAKSFCRERLHQIRKELMVHTPLQPFFSKNVSICCLLSNGSATALHRSHTKDKIPSKILITVLVSSI